MKTERAVKIAMLLDSALQSLRTAESLIVDETTFSVASEIETLKRKIENFREVIQEPSDFNKAVFKLEFNSSYRWMDMINEVLLKENRFMSVSEIAQAIANGNKFIASVTVRGLNTTISATLKRAFDKKQIERIINKQTNQYNYGIRGLHVHFPKPSKDFTAKKMTTIW